MIKRTPSKPLFGNRLWCCLAAFTMRAATLCPALASPEYGIVSLNGEWDVASGGESSPPDTFEHRVPVPGYLDQAEPAFPCVGHLPHLTELLGSEAPDYEYFWYRTNFELEAPLPETVQLILHKAAFGAQVWLNGERVAFHAPSYTPGYFNLSPFTRVGKNELLVRVGASPSQSPAVSGIEPERKKMLPGIWDDAELLLAGPVILDELQIAPNIKDSSVRIHALAQSSGDPGLLDGRCIIREWPSGQQVAEKSFSLDFTSGNMFRLDFEIPLKTFTPWSPEQPFLYEAVIELPGLRRETRFGMRSFEGRMGDAPGEGRFLLNGQVYYLRGSNICFGRWTEDPARGALPWDDTWVRALLQQWKDLNYNSFRCSISPLPRLWYAIADEEGLLIQDEYAIWQQDLQRIFPEQLAAEYRQWMAARWNHPSVVIFDAQNETLHGQNGAITGEAVERVRDLDLSRRPWDNGWMYPVRAGDASERHPYLLSRAPGEGLALIHGIEGSGERTGEFSEGVYLSPEGTIIPGGLNPLMAMEGYESVMEWSRYPMIVNEFEWLWLSRDGQAIPKRQYRLYAGTDATEQKRRALRARATATVTEFWRSARTSAAVMNFEGLSFPGIVEGRPELLHNTSDPYLDITNLTLDPLFEKEIRDANAPTGLMLDFFHATVPAAARFDIPIHLVNDRPEAVPVRLDLTLLDATGTVIFDAFKEASLTARGKKEVAFSLGMPKQAGEYQLRATLSLPSGETVSSRRDFSVVAYEPLALKVSDKPTGPVNPRLFGHFMEVYQGKERGPESVADPEYGELPWPVVKAIQSLGPTVLRYSGGILIELPGFRWTNLIDGAPDREDAARPVTTDKQGTQHTHHFGLDEFLRLCERIGAEPLLVVKATDVARGFLPAEEVIEQAAAMVAYCNAPAQGDLPPHLQRWADLRAANGRVEPYDVKLWQIGNEFAWVGVGPLRKNGLDREAITEAYVDAVDQVAAAMHAIDPDIELMAEVMMEIPAVDVPVAAQLRERLGDRITYASSHRYHSWGINRLLRGGKPIPADSLTQAEYWYAAVSAPGTFTDTGQAILRERPFENAVEAGYQPALTEWNWNSWWALDEEVNPGQPIPESLWTKGVAAASILHGILRSPQPIAIATQSMLVGNHWELRSIDVASGQPILHPSGQVTGLYRHHHGPERLAWEPQGEWPVYEQPITLGQLEPSAEVALVDCVVTADADHYYLHLINRSLDRGFTLEVQLPKNTTGQRAQLHRLEKVDDEWAARDAGEAVAVESSLPLTRHGEHWNIPLPPACVQVAVIPRQP